MALVSFELAQSRPRGSAIMTSLLSEQPHSYREHSLLSHRLNGTNPPRSLSFPPFFSPSSSASICSLGGPEICQDAKELGVGLAKLGTWRSRLNPRSAIRTPMHITKTFRRGPSITMTNLRRQVWQCIPLSQSGGHLLGCFPVQKSIAKGGVLRQASVPVVMFCWKRSPDAWSWPKRLPRLRQRCDREERDWVVVVFAHKESPSHEAVVFSYLWPH